jgi:hypothetical protein
LALEGRRALWPGSRPGPESLTGKTPRFDNNPKAKRAITVIMCGHRFLLLAALLTSLFLLALLAGMGDDHAENVFQVMATAFLPGEANLP